jgi:hypothetical protein
MASAAGVATRKGNPTGTFGGTVREGANCTPGGVRVVPRGGVNNAPAVRGNLASLGLETPRSLTAI